MPRAWLGYVVCSETAASKALQLQAEVAELWQQQQADM